jgi:hypothetical protein
MLLLFSTTLVHAQGTYTAASANESDVAAVINGPTHTAVNGDIIQIPCSTPTSVVWSSQLVVTASITITALGGTPNTDASTFGSGTNCLTIRDNVSVNGGLFYFQPTYTASNNVTTLQNVNIDPYTASTALYSPIFIIGTATSSGFPQARLDNIVFGNSTHWNESGNNSNAAWMVIQDDVIGVTDHTTLPSGSSVELLSGNFSSWLGVGQYGDESWAVPDSFGGANNWFEENNLLYVDKEVNDCETADSFADKGGCRVVNRYNKIYCASCYQIVAVHGLDTSGRPRSGRHTEAYGNTVECTTGSCQDLASYRGGTGLVWGNTATAASGTNWNQIFDITVYRNVFGNNPFGYCGGLTSLDPWDTVGNVVYYSGTITAGSGLTMIDGSKTWTVNQLIPAGAPYSVYDVTQGFVSEIISNTIDSITVAGPISESIWGAFASGDHYEIIRATVCADQGGRGAGNYISGTTPSPSSPLNQALDPVYEWDNTMQSLSRNFESNTGRVLINRDYYTTNTKGSPVAQTSPTSPFDGSGAEGIGVGFGTLANRPSTCTVQVGYFATDTNTLYLCKTANTWTASYTPYTYPHPLVTGGGGGPPPPAAPTGLTATVH